MRKPVLLIFANAMILIVVFALLAQSLFIVQRLAQADKVIGLVEVQRAGQGEFKDLKSEQMVAVGDVVRTGSDGKVEFTWADKTRWKLAPSTQLTVAKATINSAKSSEISRFRLDTGKLWVRIAKPIKEGSSFEVQTPRAVATVTGTVFSVEVKPNGATRVETFAGRVRLESGGHQAVVEQGTSGTTGPRSIDVSRTSGAAFRAQPALIRPTLEVHVKQLKGDIAIIKGVTEAGDTLTINGRRALVLGNGSFGRRFTLAPGHNEWKIVTTDKHGAKSNACRALNYNAAADESSASECR